MVENVKQYFDSLPDPRSQPGRRHRLDEMVIIAILAVICNADNWCEVEWFPPGQRTMAEKIPGPVERYPLARYLRPCVFRSQAGSL